MGKLCSKRAEYSEGDLRQCVFYCRIFKNLNIHHILWSSIITLVHVQGRAQKLICRKERRWRSRGPSDSIKSHSSGWKLCYFTLKAAGCPWEDLCRANNLTRNSEGSFWLMWQEGVGKRAEARKPARDHFSNAGGATGGLDIGENGSSSEKWFKNEKYLESRANGAWPQRELGMIEEKRHQG